MFVNTLPKVAIAPLFLMWLGYGILPNMLIGALIGFFPVVINTAVGLTQIDQDLVDLGRVFSEPYMSLLPAPALRLGSTVPVPDLAADLPALHRALQQRAREAVLRDGDEDTPP